jgi:hypothetical protein
VKKKRSSATIVQVSIPLKDWLTGPPPIDAVRPNRCPVCDCAARMLGQSLAVVGHGIRTRQLRGPDRPGCSPELRVLFIRRFLCKPCGSTMTVAPREVSPWHLYALPVIAWAIALFGLDGLRAREVRRQVSPDRTIASGSESCWRQLARWIDGMRRGESMRESKRRSAARAIALRMAAHGGARSALNAGAAWIGSMKPIGT